MLAYFPAVYPGELLYSVLARYHLHVGKPGPMHTLVNLFGHRNVIATFDLPGYLQSLADRIPPEQNLSAHRIIDKLTLFPYFTAFEPPVIKEKVRAAMCSGTIDGLHVSLGLSAFRVSRNQRLRFCPECAQVMQTTHGELWWCRDHQLPGVMVCPEHGCLLLDSKVSFSQFSRHEFVAATPENCPSHARPVVSVVDHSCLENLHRVSKRSADLLCNPPNGRTLSKWTTFYRSKMMEVGLAKSMSTMDQRVFDIEFRKFFDRTLYLLPSVMYDDDFAGDWLASMVRKHRKVNHPLYHVLVQEFLDQKPSQVSPFGAGPWPCINPLASHSSKFPIKSFSEHHNAGNRVGVYSCTCGYVYTKCLNSMTGVLGLPRFLQYGSLLEPELRKLVMQGAGLREIGRILNLDPKTVVRLAIELGITVKWKNYALSQQGSALEKVIAQPEPQSEILVQNKQLEPIKQKSKSMNRRDWQKIDSDLVSKLNTLIDQIFQENPPVRVSVAELERRSNRRGWLLKRQDHLPQSIALLDRCVEKTEDFQYRRIQWVIAQFELSGTPFKAWQVMLKAGVKSNCLELINSILEVAPIASRMSA
ncbi:MAG: TnsD family Tn7-like transposition protein [Deltaproteobacteria bacterium]